MRMLRLEDLAYSLGVIFAAQVNLRTPLTMFFPVKEVEVTLGG